MRSSYGRPAQRRGLPLPLLGGVLVLLLALVVGNDRIQRLFDEARKRPLPEETRR